MADGGAGNDESSPRGRRAPHVETEFDLLSGLLSVSGLRWCHAAHLLGSCACAHQVIRKQKAGRSLRSLVGHLAVAFELVARRLPDDHLEDAKRIAADNRAIRKRPMRCRLHFERIISRSAWMTTDVCLLTWR